MEFYRQEYWSGLPFPTPRDPPDPRIKPTKIHLIKAVVFPVVMYGCENWTVKKAGH